MTINSDVLSALIFLFFGIATVVLGWGYGLGAASQLGTGAVPVLAGTALGLLGLVQLFRALSAADGAGKLINAFSRAEIRPLVLILAAVLAFAILVVPTGLVPALGALIAIAWFAKAGGRQWELPVAMVVVILVMIAIFNIGLGLPIRLLAWRF